MKTRANKPCGDCSGSTLIIVLWVSFGLVSLALYFAHSMSLELRGADNRVAGMEADEAINGAIRYVTNFLANAQEKGKMPELQTYRSEAVEVGDASFWLLGRGDAQSIPEQPVFGLVDESGKLNLNTATAAMLEALPRMTPELAAAIIDWRDADSDVTQGGAEDDVYMRMNPSHKCKNANFETVEELRLVAGADLEILYGEDRNLNGALDINENDADTSEPTDNRDGKLNPGLLEYVTVYSREPNTRTNGSPRINVSNSRNNQNLTSLLREKLSAGRANQIATALQAGPPGQTNRSVLEFYLRSGMTADEFSQLPSDVSVSSATYLEGLVNVNTAPEAVLACLPGVGTQNAPTLVAYRKSNPDKLTSIAWVASALDRAVALQMGPYITTHSYQYSVDIAAVGHHGRGYRRVKFIVDLSEGTPAIRFRRDLSSAGWALGRQTRELLLLANQK